MEGRSLVRPVVVMSAGDNKTQLSDMTLDKAYMIYDFRQGSII